jgi:hypothetical protein
MRERILVAFRHSPAFLLFLALAACCLGAAVLVGIDRWSKTWPLVLLLVIGAGVLVAVAWRKGAV